MGILDIFKSSSNSNTRVVWRNASGKIVCPGDRCPKKCDDTCPIHLNTQAAKIIMTGNGSMAIPLYEKAVRLAPDFYDAWNNMAALYGQDGNYEKSFECYRKAHECAPDKAQPLYGLALVTRDLKRYEECVIWCDEYKKLTKDNKADTIKNEALKALNAASREKVDAFEPGIRFEEMPTFELAQRVLSELIEKDLNNGLMNEEWTPVRELADEAASVTKKIYNYIKDYYINEVNEGRIDESKLSYYIFRITMLWSAFAGIGAMVLWDSDSETLMSKGITESLTEKRGFFAMDEFVLDKVTDGFETDEANKLKARLEARIQPLLFKVLSSFSSNKVDAETRIHQFINYCIALYWYGLVLQEDRLTYEEEDYEEDYEEDEECFEEDYEDEETSSADDLSESELSNEERCGRAWIQIAGQKEKDKGLAEMRKLGDEGFDEGYLALAMFTENQNGRMALLKKAADTGNTEAKWQYTGFIQHSYAADSGDDKDREWLKYCIDAAEGGCADAMNELGNIFYRQKNYAESMYWYAMANYYGHKNGPVSVTGIAKEWRTVGMPRKYVKGTPGFDNARFICAITCLEIYAGAALTHNVNELFKLALDGTPLAAYIAGDIYERKDMLEMAYKSYNAISFEHDPHGMKCYADMLLTGRGTDRRPEDAFKVYAKAAEAGDRESMFTMGEYYRNNSNKYLSAYWYGKAYARGYEPAETRLLQLVY